MDTDMSIHSKNEVLTKLRRHYRQANAEYKRRLIDEAVAILGYHCKSAIRALRAASSGRRSAPQRTGRPLRFSPEALLPALRRVWLASHQPRSTWLTDRRPASASERAYAPASAAPSASFLSSECMRGTFPAV